jgi:hypothetical protein
MMRARGVLPVLVAAVVATSCATDATEPWPRFEPDPRDPIGATPRLLPLRVWDDPYADVNWTTTRRLLAQTHDHVGTSDSSILAYDAAGYNVIALLEYSGVASLPYAKRQRLWPANTVVSSTVRSRVANINTWAPAGEEVGFQHIVSLFLTEYIAKWESDYYPSRQPWMYDRGQGAIDLVNELGGFAILAHPWGPNRWTEDLRRYPGIEVYSAFAEHRREQGTHPFFTDVDRNADLLGAWDRALASGEMVVGFGVNDHFGPNTKEVGVSPRVRDSGKSIILASDTSLGAVREAVTAGRVFAVRDFGVIKQRYAAIDSITYVSGVITVWTEGSVRWIADGDALSTSAHTLDVSELPATTRYVRAEIGSPDGSVVYTQPMRLRQRGDVNGDWRVDAADAAICAPGREVPLTRREARACASRIRHGID